MNSDVAKSIVKTCSALKLSDANEATTRLRVIDRVLKEILGWTDEDISVEQHVSEDGQSSFSDYVLKNASSTIVVEAKKVGRAFDDFPLRRREKLNKNFVDGERGEAIVQARDYARGLGVDYAIATNGTTWIVFPAQRHDQVTFADSYGIVFSSIIDALQDNYQEFIDLLSRNAVISGSLDAALLGRNNNQLADRRLNRYFTALARGIRSNPIYPVIEDAVSVAFSDSITDLDPESLERCYVPSPDTIRFDSKIQMTVARRSSVLSSAPIRPMKSGGATRLDKIITSATPNRRPLALLLLGTVGAGKTTFLHYLRKVKLKNLFEPKVGQVYPHWCHLDFLENVRNVSPADFIYEGIFKYIKNDPFLKDHESCIKHAYAEEFEAIRSGPLFLLNRSSDALNEKFAELMYADYLKVRPYVEKILRYTVQKAPFFLVIDNVDQIEDDTLQSRLMTDALSLARSLSLNLVLCLRQSTYTKHRNSPAIDAFDFEAIQIDPPIIGSVLSKRFLLAKQILNGRKDEFVAENGLRVKLDNVADIISLVQGSVLGTEIGNLIEVLAADDVRLALRMTREFLERGYSNPGRAIEYHKQTGNYLLPKHEAYRAILLGTSPVYREDISPIGNIFDSRLSLDSAQLLRLFILNGIVRYASESNFQKIDGSSIAESMRKIGFGDNYTERVLADLCKHRFLFTESHGEATLSSSFIPSRLGGHIVREVLGDFTYVENVLFDTYISDLVVWDELRSLSQEIDGERDIVKRVLLRTKRTRVFYSYMQRKFASVVQEGLKRGLPSQWCEDILTTRKSDLRVRLAKAISSAKRNYKQAAKPRNGANPTTAK